MSGIVGSESSRSGLVIRKMPAFYATRTGGDVSANQVVVFDSESYDHTNNYNTSDGKFTAPFSGVYGFSAWMYTGGTGYFSLRINGTNVTYYNPWGGASNTNGTFVKNLRKGDYAQIYTSSYTWRGTSGYHNAFCGWWISEWN